MKPSALILLITSAAAAAAPPDVVRVGTLAFELVRIPAGEFRMGSDNRYEKPRHQVRLPPFDLARTEVTVGQFRAFTDATGYRTDAEKEGWTWVCCATRPEAASWQSRGYWDRKQGANWRNPGFAQSDQDPVVAISWADAVEFCKWLSKETGQKFRLPSEAEWEYAARAGEESELPAAIEKQAWWRDNSNLKTQPVGKKPANAWGLHDMLGNAWEWAADVWAEDYTGAPADGSPRADGTAWGRVPAGEGRPLRGGAWGLEQDAMRFAARPVFPQHDRCNNSGFRVARGVL